MEMFFEEINMFTEKYSFLSNFYSIDILYEGIRYPSVENAYQAAKSNDMYYKHRCEMCSAGGSKRLGRQIKLREDWEDVKVGIMYYLLKQKFQDNDLQKQFLETSPSNLVEGNYWHDNTWGDCYCDKCKNIRGRNILGILLMKVRAELHIKRLKEQFKKIPSPSIISDEERRWLKFQDQNCNPTKGGE